MSQIETCEQGATSRTLSRASRIITHLLSTGQCLTTGRSSESAGSSTQHTGLSNTQQCWGAVSGGCFLLSKAVIINSPRNGNGLSEQERRVPIKPFTGSRSPLVCLLSAVREKLNFAGNAAWDLGPGLCPWEEQEGGEGGVRPPSLLTKYTQLATTLAKPKYRLTQLIFNDACKCTLYPNMR